MQFGYRVINEMSAYVNNVVELAKKDTLVTHAIDLQIIQKVLPKIHGSYEKIWNPLIDLLNCLLIDENKKRQFDNIAELGDFIGVELDKSEVVLSELLEEDIKRIYNYPKSAAKIIEMLIDLDIQGFTTFIR